jgi:hypothetical protein
VGDGWTEQTEPASGRCDWPVGREIPEAERWALAAGLGAFCGEEVVIPAGVARRMRPIESVVALENATRAMCAEQGVECCDYCPRPAAFEWRRTAAELKRLVWKIRGTSVPAISRTVRCEVHRPAAAVFPEWHRCYTPLALAPAAPKVKVAAKLVRAKAPKRARKAVA